MRDLGGEPMLEYACSIIQGSTASIYVYECMRGDQWPLYGWTERSSGLSVGCLDGVNPTMSMRK